MPHSGPVGAVGSSGTPGTDATPSFHEFGTFCLKTRVFYDYFSYKSGYVT